MSSSSEYSDLSGQRPAKSPEKSSFSQTCSLLSQYLKEKGSFGDLTLGMTCNMEGTGSAETSSQSATIMNLFPTKEHCMTPRSVSARNMLPTVGNPSVTKSAAGEPKAAQLTIFYGGQVIVFDDFPAEKAKELMSIANNLNPQKQNQPSFPSTPVSANVNIIPKAGNNSSTQEHPQLPGHPVVCDLPIARKNSLHRFLEKRKDRIAARAPYHTNSPMAISGKSGELQPWLGLAAQSPQM